MALRNHAIKLGKKVIGDRDIFKGDQVFGHSDQDDPDSVIYPMKIMSFKFSKGGRTQVDKMRSNKTFPCILMRISKVSRSSMFRNHLI